MSQDLVERLRKRAEIRRQIPNRKSVINGEPDRIADLLDEAATAIDKHDRKIIFVVEFLRYNNREKHSYVGGVFKDEMEALAEAWEHMKLRSGKYGAEITGYELGTNSVVYSRTLDCWDAFAESCAATAEKLKEDWQNPEGLQVEKEPKDKKEE
jgi:hypothetical protein